MSGSNFGTFLAETGYFAYPVLGFGIIAIGLAIASFFLPTPQMRGATAAAVVSTFGQGLLGTCLGMIEAFDAVANAPPDMKYQMLAMAVSIASNAVLLALILVAIALAIGVVALQRQNFIEAAGRADTLA